MRDGALQRSKEEVPKLFRMSWILGYILLESFHVWLKVLSGIYCSILWEVSLLMFSLVYLTHLKILWLASALAWGTLNLFYTRALVTIEAESTWEFGQMFPVILLILPLLSALETYYGELIYT